MTEKKDVFVWWTTKDEAREIGDMILADNFVSAITAETTGCATYPEDLKRAILARCAHTAEPMVWTDIVPAVSADEIQWSDTNPVSSEAIRRSGIVFSRPYAPFIRDCDKGFVTDLDLSIVNIADLADQLQAEREAYAERFLEDVRLGNLEPRGPNETAAAEAAKWFNRTADKDEQNRLLMEISELAPENFSLEEMEVLFDRMGSFVPDDAPKPTDPKTISTVLTAFSDGRISERDACRLLQIDHFELSEAMRANDLPDPPKRKRDEWTVDQIANFPTGSKLIH